MPYMLGTHAIRRTKQYLERGKVIFRKNVKVVTINFNDTGDYHQGARDFVHWNMSQLQYKNPDVQILFMKNMFPTPFIRCWLDTGEDVVMDVFGKTNIEIMNHLSKILGESQSAKEEKKEADASKTDLCKFGSGYLRHCMCEIPGQVPCPSLIPLPKHMTGKYKYENNLWPKKGTSSI